MHFACKKVYTGSARQPAQAQPAFAPAGRPAAAPAPFAFAPAPLVPAPIQHPNTNVISIDLGELVQKADLLAGDPASCAACGAIFNSFSTSNLGRGGEKVWKCEFCDNENNLELEAEELPKTDTCDYMLSPALESQVSTNEPTIVFVIDISGSMCVTTELQGTLKLKGNNQANLLQSLGHNNLNDQYLPGQRRDITYVSRLQCVQAAIENQLETLQKDFPKARVGVVCFNNEVIMIGDGSKPSVTITGDKLHNYEALLQAGSQYQCDSPISATKQSLINRLYKLEEMGSTALGPAVVVAVGMCQNIPGSKIVLATDGLANTGVGSLDSLLEPSEVQAATSFYSKVANFAREKATTISVIGIRGDNINMNIIGSLADITQGDIDLVDPVNITKNFASILEAKLVATNVSVKLFLHKGFSFPEDDNWKQEAGDDKKIKLFATRNIGNAFSDSEITAQFQHKGELELSQIFEKDEKNIRLPFQVQITYTGLTGMKCLRVITKQKEISRDFDEVEKELDIGILGMHANDLIGGFAQQGRFEEAMQQQHAYGNLLSKNLTNDQERASYGAWSGGQAQLQQQILQHQPQPAYHQPAQPGFFEGFAQAASNAYDNMFGGAPSQAPQFNMQAPQPSFASQTQFNLNAPQPGAAIGNQYGAPPPQPGFAFGAQPSPYGQPGQMQPMQPQLNDEASNQAFQQRNARVNKKQWSGTRKY